jgi:S-adenosylmethionine-diacylglycerol 3-amino-3-carboxypropyl transferase
VYAIIRKLTNAIEQITYKERIIFGHVWEDPRLDKQALKIKKDDVLLTISSAGCNGLSFLLDEPKHVYLVDRNPCQNALVELKIAAIKTLEYEDFWKMFGEGALPQFSTKYYPRLRPQLSAASQQFWDSKAFYFDGRGLKRSFYWRGTCGTVAWLTSWYFRAVPGLHDALKSCFAAESLDQQKTLYNKFVAPRLWNKLVNMILRNELYHSWTGVPVQQQKLLAGVAGSQDAIGKWIKEQVDFVFSELSLQQNYFWRNFVFGRYTKECCPEYLQEENFRKLKGLVDRITVTTATITEFLQKNPEHKISIYVLLDHMDWMADKPDALSEEWNSILQNATEKPRFLWRSAAADAKFVLDTKVKYNGKTASLGSLLTMDNETAKRLHAKDLVHTYTSLHLGKLTA